MLSRRFITSSILALTIIGVSATSASAATSSATLTVTATVATSCAITGGTLAFGNYDPLSATPKDASLIIDATCAKGTTYNIGLGLGGHASLTTRKMEDEDGDLLTYELYSDSNRSVVWGDTIGTDTVSFTAADFNPKNFTVYGRIFAGQDVDVDVAYADTVAITITF